MSLATPQYQLPYPEDADAPNGPLQIQALAERMEAVLNELKPSFLPVGAIVPSADDATPAGFLACDGSAVSRTTYAALFAAIGTTFGVGNNSSTFGLPDLRGRVPVGEDGAASRLSANDARGQGGGEEKHQLSIAEMPEHTHQITDVWRNTASGSYSFNNYGGVYLNNPNTSPAGGNTPHNNMQPFQVVNYFVKF